jgi:hypothetical protein
MASSGDIMELSAILNLLSTGVEITNCMIIYIHNAVCKPVGAPEIYRFQFRKNILISFCSLLQNLSHFSKQIVE